MGSNLSKKIWDPSSSIPVTNQQLMPPFSSTELNSSYVAACKLDVDLQTFDTSLQARTSHVINSLASGVEVRALSLESLQEITECLLEMNQEVVKVILDCKKDIWRNEEVFELVEEYFDNSLKTLDFCSSLEKCLKGVKDQHLLILLALEVEDEDEDEGNGSCRYARTLEELNNFKDAGDPFTPEFFQAFQSVYRNQMLMLEKLQFKKNKLDKKLRCIHAWRKLSCIIFAATFAAVLICSVVAAAMAAPPVAAALAAATSIPLGSTGKWIDALMKNFESAVKGQREIINCMTVGTYITIKDLDTIRVLVDRLQLDIEALMGNAEFATNDGAVRVAIDEIKKKLQGEFMKSVEDLGAQADNCSRDIRRARTVILQRIIKPPQH